MSRLHGGGGTFGWRDMTAHLRMFLWANFGGSPTRDKDCPCVLQSTKQSVPCSGAVGAVRAYSNGAAPCFEGGLDTANTHTSLENIRSKSNHIADTTQTSHLGHSKAPAL